MNSQTKLNDWTEHDLESTGFNADGQRIQDPANPYSISGACIWLMIHAGMNNAAFSKAHHKHPVQLHTLRSSRPVS